MKRSVTDDAKDHLSKIERGPKESDVEYAARLYKAQMDVYSANVGQDLCEGTADEAFARLSSIYRNLWIRYAQRRSQTVPGQA